MLYYACIASKEKAKLEGFCWDGCSWRRNTAPIVVKYNLWMLWYVIAAVDLLSKNREDVPCRALFQSLHCPRPRRIVPGTIQVFILRISPINPA